MGIFIRAHRFGTPTRLHYSRALETVVGENHLGVLDIDAPEQPFFSIYATVGGYEIGVLNEHIHPRNGQLETHYRLSYSCSFVLEGLGYTFHLLACSPLAEVMALDSGTTTQCALQNITSQPHAQLSIRVAGCGKIFPLIPRLPMSVGSAESDSIYLTIPTLAPAHCVLYYEPPTVTVCSNNGAAKFINQLHESQAALQADGRLVLEPSGLELDLTFSP